LELVEVIDLKSLDLVFFADFGESFGDFGFGVLGLDAGEEG